MSCPDCGATETWVPTYCNFGHCAQCFEALDADHAECAWDGTEHSSYGPAETLPGDVRIALEPT